MLKLTCRENFDEIPLRISTALDKRKQAQKAYRHWRDHFGLSVGLFPKAKGRKLVDIPTVEVRKLKEEYPPSGHDIYETVTAWEIWEEYREMTPYPDPRDGKTWKPFHELDPNKLQHTVQENQSVIIQDFANNEIICVVIRNFSNNNRRLLDWINGVITENNDVRRSVRVSHFSIPCLSLLSNCFLARGSWKVVPDWIHFWCAEQSPTGLGAESAQPANRSNC